MPLDNQQKINHILAVVQRSFGGRVKTITAVYLTGGNYSYQQISVIFRREQVIDPEVPAPSGGAPHTNADLQIIAPLGTNFTGVQYLADTAVNTANGVQAAQKYEILEVLPVGIVPGGSHLRVVCRRLR